MRSLSAVVVYVLALSSVRMAAQVNPYKEGTPGVTGYRAEVMAEVMVQEDKLTRLAEAIPAEKYTWRPADDTRSFAEVFLHISAANYNLYKLVGTPPPTTIDLKNLEKSTTDKAKLWRLSKILSPMPSRRSGQRPTRISRRAWIGSAGRTPNAALFSSSSGIPPSISDN